MIPNSLVPCREGDHLLIVIPNYWGKGKDITEAKRALMNSSGSRRVTEAKSWIVYSVSPDTTLDEVFGQMHHKPDHPPLKIAQAGVINED